MSVSSRWLLKGVTLKNYLALLSLLALFLSACGQPTPPAHEMPLTFDLFSDFKWPGRIVASSPEYYPGLLIYIPIEEIPRPE